MGRVGRSRPHVSAKDRVLAIAPAAKCAREEHNFVVRLDGEAIGTAPNGFRAWCFAEHTLERRAQDEMSRTDNAADGQD